ncbi:putative FMP27, GFWDK domain-containing protein [Helianthus annuus]|uniref:FMP27, GFWDK domain-containing protein n=1 Tax=Helianthus annuus TaxID=4232 RepID=A0A9K3JMX2_HELAN|nr:putative FMP27, GFWDK domain-containing protein [Helianthus annuus]KAJ0604902.1 putative FMP27, GFWDK domain-containing protein [Helianthus annuus]KAJ0615540.1 putative FMP27, GFWDK domain-containing protein [Helianthus annuus]KAJ0618918.1 putative FMP27, GFWDK domain-containing protein [Helianthus annuus]KAJ0777372.1 putative FMP27, GFWDK domain-containing protein [Helianthus annuus]
MSPVKFLFTFLFISIVLWLLFIFASKLVAWILSRIMKASVAFKVGGWKCLRDVTIKFEKGAVESVSVGEIRFSLRQSLVKLGVGFMSRDPKLQLLISDIEIVTRASNQGSKKTGSQKSRKSRSSPGRGKWMVVANVARFLSISVTDLAVKTPKVTVEVKDLGVEISKDGRTKPSILVKLQLLPVVVHVAEPRISFDQSSSFSNGESFTAGQTCFASIEKASAPFVCEEFHLSSEFGHDREAGIVVKNVDITIGEVALNLNEELISGKKSSDTQVDERFQSNAAEYNIKKQRNEKSALSAVTKYTSIIPEKVCVTLPKLNVKFVHKEHSIVMENSIMGIQLKSVKSRFVEDIGESTRLDLQLDFSEIHLLKEAENSMVDILKLAVISSVYIPLQPTSPIRSEFDVKLGGTQCNLYMERLKPLMKLSSSKKKKVVLRDENVNPVTVQSSGSKTIMWTCTVSAPEMTIVLFNISGLPIYHGCSQSSHVFANNISSSGTAVHLELGELNLHMADEYQESLRETLFGVETNTGSLLHIAKISLDWGKKEKDPPQDDSSKLILVLSVDITSMSLNLTFKRVQSLLVTAFLFKTLLKASSPSVKTSRVGRSTKSSGKGIRLIKFNLERCSVNLCSDLGLENEVINEPKSVNYGSQGGRVLISVLPDGTPRTSTIASTVSSEHKTIKCNVGVDIYHFSLCLNKEKQSTQLELERARSVYQEYLEDHDSGTKVTLFDLQNAKFVRRAGGLKEIAVCSLFSATDITARWEPDVHLALIDLGLRLKLLIENQKEIYSSKDNIVPKEESMGLLQSEKNKRKKESLFAIDIEMLTVTAEAGDGVEAMIQVQSIFSENARIGVLLEGLMLSFNSSRVFKSGRMQISRIPGAKSETDAKWDWVIQAFDIHICMPYRLQLRALDDSVEEMLRALKLITAAKKKLIFPVKEVKESGAKPKKSSSSKIGCVKFFIRKLTADIEEEPIQGWLDEHYQLLKNEARELAVRLTLLESITTKGKQSSAVADEDDSVHKGTYQIGGEEIDLQDASSVEKLKEEIYKQSFRSYYRACQKLVTTEGSGAFQDGFQSGFKLSTSRTSLFSITATELDLSLSAIEGGEAGMIDFVQKLDPVALEYKIPFSRLYGCNLNLQTGSLVIQLRDYTYPLLAGTSGKCEGRVVLAQQATPFQPQVLHDVYIGRWRKVQMYRSASGTTPPMKTYLDVPLIFEKGEVSYGVGFEPAFADLSYAFTVALRRANLSVRNPNASNITPPKKEKSLPWWDEMRNYIHGKATLCFSESTFHLLATTDPYEKNDQLQISSGYMELRHSDGRVDVSAKDFKMFTSSLENLLRNSTIKPPSGTRGAFLVAPSFTLEVTMDWECESGNPLNHYLFALPSERVARDKIYDPFRSTSLSLRWNFSLRPIMSLSQSSSNGYAAFDAALHDSSKLKNDSVNSPTLNVGPHDFAWLLRFWNLNYNPPHKLRYFSRWPRFGVPRIPRSGNLSLDKVMTEFMFRIDSTPTVLRHMSLDDNDPAKGLTFKITKLKYEMCYSRGKQKYTFESKREILDSVYQGLDLHMPKVFLNKDDSTSVIKVVQMTRKGSKSSSTDRVVNENGGNSRTTTERHRDDGFLLSSDYFTIRRQSPNADPARLLAWQEAGRRNSEMTYVRSEFENGSESDEQARSDHSEDDGYNVVIADNCQRIFVYGLKLLWTIENRNAVWSWVGELSKAFAPSKPSPSRQYAQRKLLEGNQAQYVKESSHEDVSKNPSVGQAASSSKQKEASGSNPSSANSTKVDSQSFGAIDKHGFDDSDEEGTRRFMVNVIEPQFNLHSEDANGRFLLAAISGRVLARSFHAVLNVGIEMIKQALGSGDVNNPESQPELTWNRMELSVMLEHVQAHVAPTDVDPGAGLQWLPKIRRNSQKIQRTGALLERVFMPCDMYFRYTRHKGGTTDLKVKPLKELAFNSQNITATMTSRQFQVMLDVLTNLLFARLPKRSSLPKSAEDDDDIEEEADEVVPDGVEEVELERVNLEQKERARNLLFDDIRKLSLFIDTSGDAHSEKEGNLWMITGGRSTLVHRLRKELVNAQKSRKMAAASFRMAMQKAAQFRLMEKEKNKSPSCAMRISLQINKVVWGMFVDGKAFAEAEINDMKYDFDRDYKDVGLARFTTKYFVVRNCLPNAKSDMLLSAWNPPPEWGKKVMLRVDAKQGAPKDGNSPIELFQVDIYPLKIHLTEQMYRMMWGYFFPEEEQDSQRRQEVWKVSTTSGLRRAKKVSTVNEASSSNSQSTKELEGSRSNHSSTHSDSIHGSKGQNGKTTSPEFGRCSSFDRTCEESVAESVTNELMLQMQSSSLPALKIESVGSVEQLDESSKTKSKTAKTGRSSQEEKKLGKPNDEKRSRPRVMREFHNIKISQVELLVTYEGSRFAVSDLRLLMDTFHRVEFTGTWRRLFSRVKKHIIWGVLKSVTGMQGNKFKDRLRGHGKETMVSGIPTTDLNLSDSDGGGPSSKADQVPITWPKRPPEGAGDGFVTSIRGLFHSQRRKAKAFVLRTMRGEGENDQMGGGDWSESDTEYSPFARQLTITTRKLIRRHTKKLRVKKGIPPQQRDSSLPSSPVETTPYESNSSSESDPYEDFLEYKAAEEKSPPLS